MEFREVIEVDDVYDRTSDVKTQSSFESLMISPSTVANLRNHGYRVPSPIQLKAIPTGLTGFDMLVQAKSGTGKTLVFSILAVENLNLQCNDVQKMIIAPTREIAAQIKDTIKTIAHSKTRTILLVGGTPVHQDVQALKRGGHIVIGTAGRICQMAQNGNLDMSSIDLFVLDEADKLMEDCFQKDINYLFSALPPTRQVAVFSATYPKNLDILLTKFMRDPSLVRLNSDDVQLIGIKQYVVHSEKTPLELLVQLLKSMHFNRAIIFCNSQQQCEPTKVHLENAGFSSAFISAQLSQPQRDAVVEKLKQNRIKILVSTDLTARGLDATNVNLVVNLGSAVNVETYLHRIGRAARFGGYGAAVTILSDFRETCRFQAIAREGNINVKNLDFRSLPPDLTVNQSFFDSCSKFKASPDCRIKQIDDPCEILQKCSITEITTKPMSTSSEMANSSKGHYCYNRQEMMSISKYRPTLSEQVQKRLCDIGIARDQSLNPLSSSTEEKEISENISRQITPEKSLVASSPEEPKKFVPFRKARRLFYMRGDLIRIMESVDMESWKQYALTKFDMSSDPFLLYHEKNGHKGKQSTNADGLLNSQTFVAELDRRVSQNEDKQKRYSRKDLIAIQNSIPKKAWLSYVKSRWDTSKEPFQLDQYMRCSFEEQLRRQRQLEKNKRTEIMKNRQKAQMLKRKLLASSRTYTNTVVSETSFESFCERIRNKFEEYSGIRNTTSQNLGPVIPVRDSPELWTSKVDYYTKWLRNFDNSFKYDVYKEAKRISEVATEINSEELCSSPCKFENVSTQTSAVNEDGLYENLIEPSIHNVPMDHKCASEEKTSAVHIPNQKTTYQKYSSLRTLNDEETLLMNLVCGNFTNQEIGGRCGEEALSLYSRYDEEIQMKTFIENFRRNVSFQNAFSTYIWMLHSEYH